MTAHQANDTPHAAAPEAPGPPARSSVVPSTHDKALRINLDAARYGTFAEIGAGQEVCRWFFHVGGASGTVAKTISAYDMAVSDATYGPTDRYVSRKRLEAMLDHESAQLLQQLAPRRGATSNFFVFADTVATCSYTRHENGNGWLGVRFQSTPGAAQSEIIIHVHLLDREATREQEALGILGVNLLYGAFYAHATPALLIASLMDGLTRDRIEIDMIKFSGPAFANVDNRLMSLQLVEQRFTDAAMFTADGEVVQPSEVIYKRPVLVERGRFRPVTYVTLDVLHSARAQFLEDPGLEGMEPIVLMEMTLRGLTTGERGVDHEEFLARAEILHAAGNHVLISNCERYFNLIEILARYTNKTIGVALGVPSLAAVLDDQFYTDLPGGALEAMGRLFRNNVRFYIYPERAADGALVTAETLPIAAPLRHLHTFLLESRRIEPIRRYQEAHLLIKAHDVLAAIQNGNPSWEAAVPPGVATIIKDRGLFGYRKN